MNCIMNAACCNPNVLDLFKCENTSCAAITLAVAAFVAGFLVAVVLVKAFCRSCKKPQQAARKPAQQKKSASAEPRFEKRHPAPADGSIEIYVGNLSYDMTEDQLLKEFSAFGTVNSARIITNKYNGKSKGFGFVHMRNRAEVDAALAALNGKELCGRPLKCNVAKNVEG